MLELTAHQETDEPAKMKKLQLQELIMRNRTRTCSVSAARLSTPSSNLRLVTSQPYVSTLTSMVLL
jgi:hypothetical protein